MQLLNARSRIRPMMIDDHRCNWASSSGRGVEQRRRCNRRRELIAHNSMTKTIGPESHYPYSQRFSLLTTTPLANKSTTNKHTNTQHNSRAAKKRRLLFTYTYTHRQASPKKKAHSSPRKPTTKGKKIKDRRSETKQDTASFLPNGSLHTQTHPTYIHYIHS